MTISKEEWRESYISFMVRRGVDRQHAEENYAAGESEFDFEDDPEDWADAEMDCWTDDGDCE